MAKRTGSSRTARSAFADPSIGAAGHSMLGGADRPDEMIGSPATNRLLAGFVFNIEASIFRVVLRLST